MTNQTISISSNSFSANVSTDVNFGRVFKSVLRRILSPFVIIRNVGIRNIRLIYTTKDKSLGYYATFITVLNSSDSSKAIQKIYLTYENF